MKYISYFCMAIASTLLIILFSLSSCSPKPTETTSPPMSMKNPPKQAVQSPTNQSPADVTVKIRNFKFEPANLAIAVGETVQFTNTDEEPHTATATDGAFDSKGLDTDQNWNYTATKTGTFPYICSIHPFMKGTLTVTSKKT